MNDDVMKQQCPTCGAALSFDIEHKRVLCEHCDSVFPVEHLADALEGERPNWRSNSANKEYAPMEGQAGLVCTSCAAQVISNDSTVATECIYCGSRVIITDKIKGMLQPDCILPFKVLKADAVEKLKKFYGKKILLPDAFRDENRINNITGMYVPFWLFSGKGVFNYTYAPTDVVKKNNTTTTKHYELDVSGNIDYRLLPVGATTKITDDYMEGLEPFHFGELSAFSHGYLAGFYAEKFDVSVDDCTHRAKDRLFVSTQASVSCAKDAYLSKKRAKHTTTPLKGTSFSLENEDIRYAFLPVWMLNTKYKGKMYRFAINGQTGKVSGELPIDSKKLFALLAALFASGAAIFSIVFYFVLISLGGA